MQGKSLRVVLCSLAALVLLFSGSALKAQVVSGSIVGTVTDPSGSAVPGATVTATSTGTGVSRTAKTDTTGNYAINLLSIGQYNVTVEASGFAKYSVTDMSLSAGSRLRVDAKLKLGQTSQTVQVSATTVPLLNTATSSIGSTLTNRTVENVPLNGRNFIQLAVTAPGANSGSPVALSSGTRPDDRRQTSSISANGQPDLVNNYMIDGQDNNERIIGTIGVKPSIDAIQEVRVETNLYSAKYGRTAGAAINVITKAGTNQFHGSLYEFLRNDKMDAKPYFNNPSATNPLAGKKAAFHQNQFGGSVGGPIRKNKTFFFGDYEGLRIVQGTTSQDTLPSPCELGAVSCGGYKQLGNFSDLLPGTQIYDPVTHNPYPNNIIPLAGTTPPSGIVSVIDPVAANYAALLPTTATCPTPTTCTAVFSPKRTQYANTFDIRIDQHFNSKNYLYARYSFNNTNTYTPGALPPVKVAGVLVQPGGNPSHYTFPGPATERQQELSLSLTHTVSAAVILQLTASYMRSAIQSNPLNFGVNVNNAFGGPNVNTGSSLTSGLAPVSISGYGTSGFLGGLGDAEYLPLDQFDNVYQYSSQLLWTKGSQTFTFGLGLIRRQAAIGQSPSPKGYFTFNGDLTNSQEGAGTGTGGNSFAQFLLGYESTGQRRLVPYTPGLRTWEPHAFVEDDWQATQSLTLNLGVRYDIYTPYTEIRGRLSTFDPTNQSVLNSGRWAVADQGRCGRTACMDTHLHDVAPRLGFALSLPHQVVLRGGFGMTWFPTNYEAGAALKNPPFIASQDVQVLLGQNPGYTPPKFSGNLPAPNPTTVCLTDACQMALTNQTIFQATGSHVTSAGGQTLNYADARAYQYSFEIQKELAGNAITIGYVGAHDYGMRMGGNLDAPLPPLGPGGCGATTTISLPDPCQPYYAELPQTTRVTTARSTGVLNFNSVQANFRRNGRNGLTLDTNFTFSRNLTDSGEGDSAYGIYGLIPSRARAYDYGNSALANRYRWNLTLSYLLPFGKSLSGVAGQLVKGWQLNTLTTWSTGFPYTIGNGKAPQMNIGGGTDRPDVVSGVTISNPSINGWFNTSAFRKQPFGTAGNEGNNQYFGPNLAVVNFSVFKNFPITESKSVQFRVETFNLFNHPFFSNPNTTIRGFDSAGVPTTAGNFGKVTAMQTGYTPRDIQVALKFLF